MPSVGLPFVDAHHHLWDLGHHRYEWLLEPGTPDFTDWFGDYAAIRRSYSVDDFLADAEGSSLLKSVHVEAGWSGPDPVGETRWVQSVADGAGIPNAIVAYADLRQQDVEAELDRHCEQSAMRGVRMAQMEGLLADARFHRGLAALERRGLSYDLNLRWPSMEAALDLASALPDLQIIVGNTANPRSLSDEEFGPWRRGMQLLAQAPNVAVKISGLGMADHDWTVERIRPWILATIEAFGPERCMFGTNWPVDRLYSGYRALVQAYETTVAGFTHDEQEGLFSRNAERFYRI